MATLVCLYCLQQMPATRDMPRKSQVPVEDGIDVVKKFMMHFLTTKIPAYTSPVWKEMSAELRGRWTPHDVYTNVRENRRGILTISREELAIEVRNENEVPLPQCIDNTENRISRESNDGTSSDSDNTTYTPDENPKRKKVTSQEMETTEFEVFLTEKEWNLIKPVGTVRYGKRNTVILRRGVWTNVITIAFWIQYKSSCAFVYKRANVKASDGSYVIDIQGKCRRAECGNKFRGHGEKRKDEEGLIIRIVTRDTSLESHSGVKRPFNGDLRKQAAQEMIREGCTAWRRRKAREYMKDGDLEPAFIPNADVLRQARKQGLHANLNVKAGDSRDLIRTIENIAADPEYLDLIHAVGSLPFYVFFSTPAQLDAYKKYLCVNRKKSTIIVDSTGSLVRKLDRPGDTNTGHIFLYSIVVNFEGTTQPVHQMLSEKHNVNFILYWLNEWLYRGAPKPKEAVSDYSRALINALCLAFNNRTIKSYLDICFAIIENDRGVIERPPTIIRIDVARFIHMICRWPCFVKVSQSCIKEFFVRCVALMVECTSLDQFQRAYTLTCAVALQTHDDSELALEIPRVKTAKDARTKLEGYIAIRQIEGILEKYKPRDDLDYTVGPFKSEPFDSLGKLDDDTKSRGRLENWIEQQKESAEKTVIKGRDPNPFYLPGFITELHKLAKEFPLWTGVAVGCSSPHATSSYVEAYFNDIKTRVFTAVKAPARVDIFLKELARNIIGETLLFASKLTKSEMRQAELEPTKKIDGEQQQQQQREGRTAEGEDNEEVDLEKNETLIASVKMKEVQLEKMKDISTVEICKESYIPEFPHLHLTTGELSFESPNILEIPVAAPEKIKEMVKERGHLATPNLQDNIRLNDNKLNIAESKCHNEDENLLPSLDTNSNAATELQNPELAKTIKYFVLSRNSAKESSDHEIDETPLTVERAIDDLHYAAFIEKSQNETLKFVTAFMKHGLNKNILRNRVHILKEFYEAKIDVQTENRVISYVIDTRDSMENIVRHTMLSEPSVYRREQCSHCNGRIYYSVTLSPNHNIISKRGFGTLEAALGFKPAVYDLTCSDGCSGKFTLFSVPNVHLFIDLDIRDIANDSLVKRGRRLMTGLQCLLSDFPRTIDLAIKTEGNKRINSTAQYSLAGVVGYSSSTVHTDGHFIAYCRRYRGRWQIYNDIRDTIRSCKSDTIIEPHLAIYVLDQD